MEHVSAVLDDIAEKYHAEFLHELLHHYVDKQGLGGIPKPDLDALLIYLYCKYSGNAFDTFALGQLFMVKESRIKSLYETGQIKYAGMTEGQAWVQILSKLSQVQFDLDSKERGQVKFKFENPALYKYLQKRVRDSGGTVRYSSASETVTIALDKLFALLEHIYDCSQTEFASRDMDQVRPFIEQTIAQIGSSLGQPLLAELQHKKGLLSTAGKALNTAARLSSIGRFVKAMLAM